MKHNTSSGFTRALVCAALFLAGSASLFGQQKVDIGKIEFDDIPSPQVSSGKGKNFRPKDWLEFEVDLKLSAGSREEQASGFIDRVTVKWYVAVENPEGNGFVLLTKDVDHINVPVDEEVYSSVYLSPNTLKRLTGKDKAGKGSVDRVAAEILVNGRTLGVESSKGNASWVRSGNLSNQSQKFPLLNKNETPFKMLWWDRYAEIEERR